MTKTYWNGEPCEAEQGSGVMLDSPEHPRFWGKAAGLVGQRVPVVRVTYNGQTFYLYDAGSQAWFKITEGKGSPWLSHADLKVSDYEPTPMDWK